jgi:ABC-type transport system involved in multi-copper enzyme maturation permease subunit
MILHVMRHELLLFAREPRFWIPFFLPPALLFASQAILLSFPLNAELTGQMLLLTGILMAPMSSPLAADSFAGERERGSLELLCLSPVRPADLFWGKFFAVLPFPVIFALCAQCAYALLFPQVTFVLFWKASLASVSFALWMTGLSLLVSLSAKTVRSATQVSLFLVLPLILFAQWESDRYFASNLLPALLPLGVLAFLALCACAGLRKFRRNF